MGHEFGIRYCIHVQQAEIVGNVGFFLGNSSLGAQFMLFTMNLIFYFFVFISLTFFLYCCISEFFVSWLSISFKSGCQRISRAIHRRCQVCCVNCNSLICPTFLFQTKAYFCPTLLCVHSSSSRRLFLSLLYFRDRFSSVVRAVDSRVGDPEFDFPRCDLKSFFRLLSFPCSLK